MVLVPVLVPVLVRVQTPVLRVQAPVLRVPVPVLVPVQAPVLLVVPVLVVPVLGLVPGPFVQLEQVPGLPAVGVPSACARLEAAPPSPPSSPGAACELVARPGLPAVQQSGLLWGPRGALAAALPAPLGHGALLGPHALLWLLVPLGSAVRVLCLVGDGMMLEPPGMPRSVQPWRRVLLEALPGAPFALHVLPPQPALLAPLVQPPLCVQPVLPVQLVQPVLPLQPVLPALPERHGRPRLLYLVLPHGPLCSEEASAMPVPSETLRSGQPAGLESV